MSALPPKADIDRQGLHVRFVPKADIAGLFDHLVGGQEAPVAVKREVEEDWGAKSVVGYADKSSDHTQNGNHRVARQRQFRKRISSTEVFRMAPHVPSRSGPRHALVHGIGLTRRTSPGRGRQALLIC
jgi:hypothetical protein